MRYYLDCEFDGLGGPLISMGLVREDGTARYWILPYGELSPWVSENVAPVLRLDGQHAEQVTAEELAYRLSEFISPDTSPIIVADWPDDIKYFCEHVIKGSLWWEKAGGPMQPIVGLSFEVVRVDAYPTELPGAVRHNALWDALALRYAIGWPQTTIEE